jgi:hypothetical protein
MDQYLVERSLNLAQMTDQLNHNYTGLLELKRYNIWSRYSSYTAYVQDRLTIYINRKLYKQYKVYAIHSHLSIENQEAQRILNLTRERDLDWRNEQHRSAMLSENHIFHQKVHQFYRHVLGMSDSESYCS